MKHVMLLHENYQFPNPILRNTEIKAFVYQSPKLWNELPTYISQKMSLHSFKSALKMHFIHIT